MSPLKRYQRPKRSQRNNQKDNTKKKFYYQILAFQLNEKNVRNKKLIENGNNNNRTNSYFKRPKNKNDDENDDNALNNGKTQYQARGERDSTTYKKGKRRIGLNGKIIN